MSSLLVGYTVQKVDTGGDVLAKLVLLILADYANSEGKAWPSLDTLAKQAGRSEASVKRARAKLVDLGLIAESDDQGYTLKYRGDRRPKVYDVLPTVDMPERPARPARPAATPVPPQRNTDAGNDGAPMSPRQTDDGAPVHPRTGHGGSPMHPTGAHPCTERGLTHEPQTVIVNNKLFTNRQSEPTRASARRPDGTNRTDEPQEPGHAGSTQPTTDATTAGTAIASATAVTPTDGTTGPGMDATGVAGEGIDAWTPDAESLALAAELRADVESEAGRFRLRVRSSGDVPRDPDAAFRKWLRRGASYGILVRREPARPCDRRPEPASTRHTHRWDCAHVLDLMRPHEADYSHERDGWAPSEWMLALEAAAVELNRQEAEA